MEANTTVLVNNILDNIVVINGARGGEDSSIYAGIGFLKDISVTFIAQTRAYELNKCIETNFSMTLPEGYRKIIRLVKQAERFNRPIILFVDTIGADASDRSETQGQAYRIAECMYELMRINVPIISILCGEGGSGGALALCVADTILALNEGHLGVASIKACQKIIGERYCQHIHKIYMKASQLKTCGLVNKIVGLNYSEELYQQICELKKIPTRILRYRRLKKYRYWDRKIVKNIRDKKMEKSPKFCNF